MTNTLTDKIQIKITVLLLRYLSVYKNKQDNTMFTINQ